MGVKNALPLDYPFSCFSALASCFFSPRNSSVKASSLGSRFPEILPN